MFSGHPTLLLRLKYDKTDFNTPHHYDSALYNPCEKSKSYMVNSVSLFSQTQVRHLSATRPLSHRSPVNVIQEVSGTFESVKTQL
jgi:hypothetical protein